MKLGIRPYVILSKSVLFHLYVHHQFSSKHPEARLFQIIYEFLVCLRAQHVLPTKSTTQDLVTLKQTELRMRVMMVLPRLLGN